MKNVALLSAAALLVFSVAANANPSTRLCQFTGAPEWAAKDAPKIKKTCNDFDGPFEECSNFEVSFITGKTLTSAQVGLPPKDGIMPFKPVGMSFIEESVGGDSFSRWEVYFIDNSGSPSSAEERWIVFDGNGKQLSKLINMAGLAAWKKSRDKVGQGVDNEIMLTATCK